VAATAAYWNIPLITEDKHFRKLKQEIALTLVER
jgi:predicted nucleic acid-binding protein